MPRPVRMHTPQIRFNLELRINSACSSLTFALR